MIWGSIDGSGPHACYCTLPMSGRLPPPAPKGRSRIRFPAQLPISARVRDIVAALDEHQVLIVAGATGSGKTTQLPKVALEMGRGGRGQIGVTQPRRLAATSVAARVAEELDCQLGIEVGYQIRFEDRSCADTWVKFMTDGILLAETQGDPLLRRYDTLIIDEAHERSLTIDFLLGWLKRILPQRRDLKVIVSSATIETERFSEFFGGAPVIQVEGRTFPVDVLYQPPAAELDLPDAVAAAVQDVTSLDPRGDILVFLPGEREIRDSEFAVNALELRHTVVQPLYARLSAAEQAKVFASIAQRRVILATNVAETSLTIPGIVYVIDTGVARLSRYDSATGTTRLQIEAISQASADQRKGRCGRVRDGICVRLYDEESYAARPAFTDPEMKRTGLAGVILRMKALGLGSVEDFPFLDPPQPRSITEGYRVLQELGALTDERELTELGRNLARLPLDPRLGRMILAGAEFGCLSEIMALAAGLSIQEPRERPRGQEAKADLRHQRFRNDRSDFLGLWLLWEFVHEQKNRGSSQLRRACKEHFLSFSRIREWLELHHQLESTVRELRLSHRSPPRRSGKAAAALSIGQSDAIHMALLTGLLSRIGQWSPEPRLYLGARQTRFVLHPSSALSKKPPAWVMTFELLQTARLFARISAKIEPVWIDRVGSHLLKRSYSDPHWSEKSARATVKEHATLYGLPVLRDRRVDYATIAPGRARLMFLEHALVRGEYSSRGSFCQKNRELLRYLAQLQDKARRSEMPLDEDRMLSFFDQRVPETVVNGKSFEAWREIAEKTEPELLHLAISDVISDEHCVLPEQYPDRLKLRGVELAASYRFDPAADDDGITLDVPLVLLPQLETGELDWTIPAWHESKIASLLQELPRTWRRELSSVPGLAAMIAEKLEPFSGPLLPALCRAVLEHTGVDVPPEAFRLDTIPRYLCFNIRVIGERGRALAQGRDVGQLVERYRGQARELLRLSTPSAQWEREGLTTWDCGQLPPFIPRTVMGIEIRAYPGLVDRQSCVALSLFESEAIAETAHRAGVRRLLQLAVRGPLSALAKRVPAPFTRRLGVPASVDQRKAFRDALLARVVDEAFGLQQLQRLPRAQADFDRVLGAGAKRLNDSFELALRSVVAVSAQLDQTLLGLAKASKARRGSAAVADIQRQLEVLFPDDLLSEIELSRLAQYPRYLLAAQTRLTRAILDPGKDLTKAAPFAQVWNAFVERKSIARDRRAVERLQWALEELRVAIFAPELKPAQGITLASASLAVEALR